MDLERAHRSGSSSSTDLFVCFTSRFCSFSSMKMSSKSILSPGCTEKFREPKLSSSSSLSRRLRTSGSIKGGQSSPMLILTGSKKRGYAFENPEPSSPKVTCIGQVRVRTRKQGRSLRDRSRRTREAQQTKEQRECLPHRNQKWVQLPLTICEAVRAFGAEFNCFLPCGGRSLCSSMSERDKSGKRRTTNGSCGAVFARWLMALQEDDEERVVEEKRREMEVKRGKPGELLGEIEIEIEEEKGEEEELLEHEQEEERISICIPPRNALLLMRCRSDPVRISALANRFWDPYIPKDDDDEEEDEDEHSEDDGNDEEKTADPNEQVQEKLEQGEKDEVLAKWVSTEVGNQENFSENEDSPEDMFMEEQNEQAIIQNADREQQRQQELELEEEEEEEIAVNCSLFESFYEVESPETEDEEDEPKTQHRVPEVEEEEEEKMLEEYEESASVPPEEPSRPCEEESELKLAEDSAENIETQTEKNETNEEKGASEDQTMETQKTSSAVETEFQHEKKSKESENTEQEKEEEEEEECVLPDCLLSMLWEPKLSMEISKETWVCSRDFIRWNSTDQVNRINGSNKQVNEIDGPDHRNQNQEQPPRPSFSNPTATKAAVPSMAAGVMQKLVSAVAREPFVLPRCKSEPLRSSARLVPEACSWKNQNLQPHRRTALGVGAAGVGLLAQPKC